MEPYPDPSRNKIPPLPPILVGSLFFGENENQDPVLSEHYSIGKSLSESEMLLEISPRVISAYNEAFKNEVKIAFCVICGNTKDSPWRQCNTCKYEPRFVGDLAMHFATTAFNPKILNKSSNYRLNLVKKFIENNNEIISTLAAGMLEKMRPILEMIKI